MARERFTVSITDEEIAEWLRQQPNVSAYIRRLVEADMGASGPVPAPGHHGDNNVVLDAILEEIRGLRGDLASVRVNAAVIERPSSTRRTPAGLEKQMGKFKEGQR